MRIPMWERRAFDVFENPSTEKRQRMLESYVSGIVKTCRQAHLSPISHFVLFERDLFEMLVYGRVFIR